MALHDQLGFESPLVLMKLGYDLRERMDGAFDAPIPETFEPFLDRMAAGDKPRDVLTLLSSEYRQVDDALSFTNSAG